MPGGDHERTTATRRFEREEVFLDEVSQKDVIILHTATGSVYNLLVVEVDENRPRVVMERDSDHAAQWEGEAVEIDQLSKFSVEGSCDPGPRYYGGAELKPQNLVAGQLAVGRAARLLTENGDELITSSVASIEIVTAN
jgi:hypothetical protein